MQIKKTVENYRDTIPYIVFGIFTTLVNILVYWLCAYLLSMGIMVSTIVAWFAAVAFAYVTNRKWVFHSEVKTARLIFIEVCSFFGCRLATGLLDCACMFIFAAQLGCNDVVVKTISNVIVIILNYIASKFFIFSKRDDKRSQ